MVGAVLILAGVAAAVAALLADGGGSGAESDCDAAGICFELPEGWALGQAEPGVGTLERNGEAVARYTHEPNDGIDDVAEALARTDGCEAEPTATDVGGTPGARCDNPDGADPQLIVATVANGRAWGVFFDPDLPGDEVEAVVDGITFTDE